MHRLQVLEGHLHGSKDHAGVHVHGLRVMACKSEFTEVTTAIVCGGVVLDVQARPVGHDLQSGSSVPGEVQQVPGGVARNIAEAASRLIQAPLPAPLLVSVAGKDAAGNVLMDSLRKLRLDVAHLRQVDGVRTASVCAVFDRQGEVAACVADVTSLENYLHPDNMQAMLHEALSHHLSTSSSSIGRPPSSSSSSSSALVVLEANLASDSICRAAAMAHARGIPVIYEPVSVPKSVRAVACLHHIDWITPNANELGAMAGAVQQQRQYLLRDITVPSQASCRGAGISQPSSGRDSGLKSDRKQVPQALLDCLPHAATVLAAGTKKVALTLGASGACLITTSASSKAFQTQQDQANSSNSWQQQQQESPVSHSDIMTLRVQYLPAIPAKVVNLSGAGDTLVGGIVAGLVSGLTDIESLAIGMAAAKQTVECLSNVAPSLVFSEARADAQALLQSLVQLEAVLATSAS